MRCYRRLLDISHKDHVPEEIRKKIKATTEEYDDLLIMVKKQSKIFLCLIEWKLKIYE